jgi:GNAT superfamily N-acetyltransferase
MRTWTRAEASALCALVDATLPGEQLSADELVSACFDDPDPSTVLALPGGEGAIAAVVRASQDGRIAHLMLIAVEPAAQGQGRGRRLLAAAEDWAFNVMGAGEVQAGGWSPFGLWPGVDVRWTRSLCLFEAAGYEGRQAGLTLSCPSTHRAPPPEGVAVRRALEDVEAIAARRWSDTHLPGWGLQVERALDHGCCLVALAEAEIAGLVCHSVNRAGWIGPLAVSAHQRRRGIGRALLGAACADLGAAGLPDVQITTPTPVEFYARSAGASVSRVFWQLRRVRPSPPADADVAP